jgi:hypothetical protein
MASAKDKAPSRVVIPRKLKMSLLKLQVDEDLSWEEACLRATAMLARQKRTIDRAVAREANRRYKSRHLSELNKARKTIREQGYVQGYADGHRTAMMSAHFTVPCPSCGKPMRFAQTQPDWNDTVQPMLNRAFIDRIHVKCQES